MQSIGSGLSVGEMFSGKMPLGARVASAPAEPTDSLPTDQAQLSSVEPPISKSKSRKSSKSKSHKHGKTSESNSSKPQAGQTATGQGVSPDGVAASPSTYSIIQGVFAGVNDMPGLTAEQKLAQSQHILEKIFSNGAAPQVPGNGGVQPGNEPPVATPPSEDPVPPVANDPQADYEAATKIYNDIWAARRQNQVDCMKIFQDTMSEINKINSDTYAYIAKRQQENIDGFNGYLGWDGTSRR